jgi:hypothetical protein
VLRDVDDQLQALFARARRGDVAGFLDRAAHAERLGSSSSLPDSILEKSRMSLITASSWSLDRRMVCR